MSLEVRALTRDDLQFYFDLKAAEDWNPGLYDGACFIAADPEGSFVAELDGEKIGCISATRYDTFGFIGSFVVRKDQRGKGYGRALWEHATAHLDGVPITLDAALPLEEFYTRAGFARTHLNVRYRCDAREPRDRLASGVMLERLRVLDDEILEYDRTCSGAGRAAFLQAWVAQPDVVALLARSLQSGEILGYGVGRECRDGGTKIGPLYASRLDVPIILFDTIALRTRSPWYITVPAANTAALGFADERGLTREFDCARMWRGNPPETALQHVFGT